MTVDQLDRALDELVERCDDVQGDWAEVLRRAGVRPASTRPPRGRSRRSRRALVAVVVATAAVAVATAFAAGLGHRFSAWISGAPGRPAPAGLQHGFEVRNNVAYAGFPAGTKLRLLSLRTVGGTRFSLLGFRNHDTYRLRLVRADRPSSIGRNECLRAEELSDVPALVAGDVWFSVGDPAKNVNGVYGFAADDVRSISIVRLRGGESVRVVNNVFLSLTAARAGSVQNHPRPNPVIAVKANLRDGSTKVVPYTSGGGAGGLVPNGKRPAGPSYFGRPPAATIPGPTSVERPIARPTIGWLKRREPRGGPLPPIPFGNPGFGRLIQPDPDDPLAIRSASAPGEPSATTRSPRSRRGLGAEAAAAGSGTGRSDSAAGTAPRSRTSTASSPTASRTSASSWQADGSSKPR